MRFHIVVAIVCGCGGGAHDPAKPAPPPTAPAPRGPSPEVQARAEQAHHDELAAQHRALESASADALAATCPAKSPPAAPRCLPGCYATEPADPRVAAAKKLSGTAVAIDHWLCEAGGAGSGVFVLADELAPAGRLGVRKAVRGHFPAAHKASAWQGAAETALRTALARKGGPAVAVVVTGTAWRATTHPLTGEPLRCTAATEFVASAPHAVDGCGEAAGNIACEATGDGAARALDIVHFRLAEARKLQTAGKRDDCQTAAREAIAVARGLPRWRQYVKLNIAKWVERAAYRTRFDGILDEDALFARTAALGAEAETTYVACAADAGATPPRTAPDDEQSFHACW